MKTLTEIAAQYRFAADATALFAKGWALLDGHQVEERSCIATAIRYTARAENCRTRRES